MAGEVGDDLCSGGMRIVWVHLAGFSCLAVLPDCPVHLVVCGDHGREHEAVTAKHASPFLSLERRTRQRLRSHVTDVDGLIAAQDEELIELLRGRAHEGWEMVCPFPSSAGARVAGALGIPFRAPDLELCHWLDAKSTLHAALHELGLPLVYGRWLPQGAIVYADLAGEFGARLVLQLAYGSGGSGTRMVADEGEFIRARRELAGRDVWVAPYLGGLSFNVNAIALAGGVVVSFPSVQLVGFAALGADPGEYCGNDFAAATLHSAIVDDVVAQSERLGRWLLGKGFRGMFGIDFVVDERTGRPVAVDLNPRWQGSTVLLSHAERAVGRRPLAVEEVALRLSLLDEREVLRNRDVHLGEVAAAQVTLRLPPSRGPALVTGAVGPGIWHTGTEFARAREGLQLADCRERDEVLLTGAVPETGTLVYPGAYLLRLYARRAMIDADSGRLQPWVERLLTHVEGVLALTAVGEGPSTS